MTKLPTLYSPYDKPMWESAAEKQLRIQKCSECGTYRYPPGPACPECLSFDSRWEIITGRGNIMSWTVFHRKYLEAYPPPNLVVVVMLEEGAIMVANMPAEQVQHLKIDAAVEMFYEMHPDGFMLPRFRLEDAISR